jgi:hypothetical protein
MTTCTLEHLTVASDTDLILLRQSLRRNARQYGLSSTQQARITAAISEVMRALVGAYSIGDVTIRFDDEPGERPALAVICSTPNAAYAKIQDQPLVIEACGLADQLDLTADAAEQQVIMRMWATTPRGTL